MVNGKIINVYSKKDVILMGLRAEYDNRKENNKGKIIGLNKIFPNLIDETNKNEFVNLSEEGILKVKNYEVSMGHLSYRSKMAEIFEIIN